MIHALHGNFGLPSDWDAALPPGVPAKAWHLWEIRRHHPETRTLTGFAAWFNNQIESLPPDPCRILAGYSLGGRLALHVLLDRPALWRRALIISAHPGLPTEAERADRRAHDLLWQERCLHQSWAEVCRAWNAQPILQNEPPCPNAPCLKPWLNEIASAFEGWSLGHQLDLLPKLAKLHCPVLWLAGEKDSKFSALARSTVNLLSFADSQIIADAGHRLLSSHPDAVRAAFSQIHHSSV